MSRPQRVAKVLPSNLSDDITRRQHYEPKTRAVALLSRLHFCGYYDVCREGQKDFLVLEHLEGETLVDGPKRGPMRTQQANARHCNTAPNCPPLILNR